VTYSGKCVGGPWDRRIMAHEGKVYQVVMRPRLAVASGSSEPAVMRCGTYKWQDDLWFWFGPDYRGT